MTILAIESSCDDTSAAILVDGKVVSNTTSSQKIHEKYGGVVPEVASRQHHLDIIPVVNHALTLAHCQLDSIGVIAFTRGPGLLGSLLVGTSFAKALSLALDKPLIEVHHMKAHIMAHFIDEPKPKFPFLCLTVSGGHTQIVKVNSGTDMIILGQTIDDAAGEAFDKTGKMLGLGYPAGPEIDRRADIGKPVYSFSETKLTGLDFSFSGFKTSVLYFLQKEKIKDPDFIQANLNDLCASIQSAIIHMLVSKVKQASIQTGITEIAIAGGVAANSGLRKTLLNMAEEHAWKLYVPDIQYCTDNAGMIAMAAWFKYKDGQFSDLSTSPDPRWTMDQV